MTVQAKRRASSSAIEADRDMSPESAPRSPLAAPSGPQVFDVGVAGAGERLDRFLSQGAAASNRPAQENKLDCRGAARHFTPNYFFGRGFWSSEFRP